MTPAERKQRTAGLTKAAESAIGFMRDVARGIPELERRPDHLAVVADRLREQANALSSAVARVMVGTRL